MNKKSLNKKLKSASPLLKDFEALPQPDLDTTKGIILYLEGINVNFDSFKAITDKPNARFCIANGNNHFT